MLLNIKDILVNNTSLLTTTKWLGLICVVAGAVATSLSFVPVNIIAFNSGSLLYAVWGMIARDYNIALVNVLLLIIYSIGIILHV